MSYCDFCYKMSNECVCPIDLIEPRLEIELTKADNIMATENPVVQRTHTLTDVPPVDSFSLLKEIQQENIEDYKTPNQINIINEALQIPKLERRTNRPTELCIKEDDLNHLKINLFKEEQIDLIPDIDLDEEDYIINVEECEECHEFICVCESIVQCTMPGCNNLYNLNDTDPSFEMCFQCEMKERKQALIDELLYPDDIPMELRYNSDRDSF